jgi:DNA-binding GntR family transcriptional regulator
MLDPELPVTLWEQLAQILRDKISSGEITGRVPSAMSLAQTYNVSHRTTERALKALKDQGLIVPVFGRGYFVARPE